MNYGKKLGKHILMTLFLLSLFPTVAYAYLDPGTGSYVFQVLVGALLGGAFAIKMFWRNIKTFISGVFGKTNTED